MKRKPLPSNEPPSTGPAGTPGIIARRSASPRRRWLFSLIAFVGLPLFVLAVFEIALRAAGYGYPTRFFRPGLAQGQKVFVENEKFGWRFFPRRLARRPLPLSFTADKPADTVRIFVLGESAAMGDPEPAFGFSRILEVLLRERFSGAQFEVLNVAFTAINSHVILPIARECARQHGDLWIVYMGNNEVMGPFGAGTVFNTQSPHRIVIRASLALKTLKLGQLTDQVLDWFFASPSTDRVWTGMEMFLEQQIRQSDHRLDRVYEHFRKNLSEIVRLATGSGAKVIVGTVASNLRDCAPLGSLHSTDLSEVRNAEWSKVYQAAGVLEAEGQFAQAIDRYLEAERIDSTYAELSFRLANCYMALTNRVEARRRYEQARDLDTLRFRADSEINAIIREIAARHSQHGASLVESEAIAARSSSDGIPGDELFFDHVHFNFEGNFVLARAFAEQAIKALPASFHQRDTGVWASADTCSRRLGLTGWNSYQMHESMQRRLSTAPFNNQLNHTTRRHRYQSKLVELRLMLESSAITQAVKVCETAVAGSPNDPVLRENLARLLQAAGDSEAALAQYRRLIEPWPHYTTAYYNMGSLLLHQGKLDDAEQQFLQALKLNSDFGEAYNGLGSVLMNRGHVQRAADYFAKALQLRPGLWEAHLNLALGAEKQGNSPMAMTNYSEALRLNPSSYSAHLRIGELLMRQGDALAASKHISEAVRIRPQSGLEHFEDLLAQQPDDPATHFKMANALAALDQPAQALENLRRAVALKPDFWEAKYLLGVELAVQGKLVEAQGQFQDVVRLRPEFALAHLNLGVAMARQSRLNEAAIHFRETLRLQPTNAAAKQFLQTLQSITNATPAANPF